MGKRKNTIDTYKELSPEDLYTHVRKNISIPKYMDLFLYEQNISLSKLVQNAITTRMESTKTQSITKSIKQETMRKKITENQQQNPQFKQELHRARLLLTQYFTAFDIQDNQQADLKKQLILSDFPEMYVDVIRFEQWYKNNQESYDSYQKKFDNPVQRLIAIKKECL